jgi:hypothetical protein
MPREPLSTIAVRTLVIHGRDDPMFPLEYGEAAGPGDPGARLRLLGEPGRESSEPIGRPSPMPSSRPPSPAIVAGDVAELEQRGCRGVQRDCSHRRRVFGRLDAQASVVLEHLAVCVQRFSPTGITTRVGAAASAATLGR